MNLNYIKVNTQSSIKFILDKVIYFDPFKIDDELHDADIIFITHEHYDHFDIESIDKIRNDETIIVSPKSMEEIVRKIYFKKYIFLNPNEEINIDNLNVLTIPAYNIDKPFHPKNNNWLGYILTYNNVSYYIAGDTDKTKENESISCDIAFLPIGGHFTMDYSEAASLAKIIKPKVVIPTHYGTIVGDKSYGKKLKELLSDTDIEVVLKYL